MEEIKEDENHQWTASRVIVVTGGVISMDVKICEQKLEEKYHVHVVSKHLSNVH